MIRTLLFRAWCAAVLAFLLVPIAAIVPLSFSSGSFLTYPLPGLSLRWYAEVRAAASGSRRWATRCSSACWLPRWRRCWARWRRWGWRASVGPWWPRSSC